MKVQVSNSTKSTVHLKRDSDSLNDVMVPPKAREIFECTQEQLDFIKSSGLTVVKITTN